MPEDDRYTIPDSGGVLRNKLGLTTQQDVDQAMNISATSEWSIIQTEPIPDRLDLDYLRSIHRRFMSPVLDWAGKLRQVGDEVCAVSTPFQYAASQFYKDQLDKLMGQLADEDYLRGLSTDEFVERLADRWGTLTHTHPFRDGNTRSQSAYVDRLAMRAGHPIDWCRVEVSALREARLSAAFRMGGEKVLADYLRAHLIESQDASAQRGTGLVFSGVELGSVLRASFPKSATDVARSTSSVPRPKAHYRGKLAGRYLRRDGGQER